MFADSQCTCYCIMPLVDHSRPVLLWYCHPSPPHNFTPVQTREWLIQGVRLYECADECLRVCSCACISRSLARSRLALSRALWCVVCARGQLCHDPTGARITAWFPARSRARVWREVTCRERVARLVDIGGHQRRAWEKGRRYFLKPSAHTDNNETTHTHTHTHTHTTLSHLCQHSIEYTDRNVSIKAAWNRDFWSNHCPLFLLLGVTYWQKAPLPCTYRTLLLLPRGGFRHTPSQHPLPRTPPGRSVQWLEQLAKGQGKAI